MGTTQKRVEGAIEEVGGKIKGAVGKLVGNKRMETEGKGHEYDGQDKQEDAKAMERVKGAGEQVIGKVKGGVGKVLDKPELEAEGLAEELRGKARAKANRSGQ